MRKVSAALAILVGALALAAVLRSLGPDNRAASSEFRQLGPGHHLGGIRGGSEILETFSIDSIVLHTNV